VSRHYIKSNSVLVAVDLPGHQASDRRGLAFIGLQDSFGFSVDVPRNSSAQIGSQKEAFNAPALSPDVSFDLSFIPTRKFANENILGLNFGFNNEFVSVFNERSETSFNVYLFTSEKQSYDFIQQIKSQQSLNGVECLAIGNCFITNYGFSMSAGDLARASASFVGSNIEASVVSSNRVKVPAIDLESGEQNNYFLSLDWAQISLALDEITKESQPILPTTEVRFSAVTENLEIPSAIFSPLKDAKIQSLDLSLSIPRETVYKFGSNFPCGRKIIYPAQGQLSLSSVVGRYSTGNFTGLMGGEEKYDVRLDFLDPQDLFLSGKTSGQLSGFLNTGISGATGFFTESRSLKIENARLNSYSQSFPINDLVTANASLSFQCHESGGLSQKFGVLTDGAQPYYLYSPQSRKLFDSNGNLLTLDPFLYMYDQNCNPCFLLDINGNLLLADNWAEQNNACPYTPTTTTSPPVTTTTTPVPTTTLPPTTTLTPTTTTVPPQYPAPPPNIYEFRYPEGGFAYMEWTESSPLTQYIVQRSEDGVNFMDVATDVTSNNYYDGITLEGNYWWYRIIANYNNLYYTTGDSYMVYYP
jgi:hypothetical protein